MDKQQKLKKIIETMVKRQLNEAEPNRYLYKKLTEAYILLNDISIEIKDKQLRKEIQSAQKILIPVLAALDED